MTLLEHAGDYGNHDGCGDDGDDGDDDDDDDDDAGGGGGGGGGGEDEDEDEDEDNKEGHVVRMVAAAMVIPGSFDLIVARQGHSFRCSQSVRFCKQAAHDMQTISTRFSKFQQVLYKPIESIRFNQYNHYNQYPAISGNLP